ncbi:MAG: hypothetical protein ACREFP_13245 [Acetobacteraceae bacterium]
MSNRPRYRYDLFVITRDEMLRPGIACGTSGGLIDGIMLGIGTNLMIGSPYPERLLPLLGATAPGIFGWPRARERAIKFRE